MKNSVYWAQRMKRMEDALKDQSYAYVENLERQFSAAQAEVQRQLAAWYQRFADNNGLTLADARRLLNNAELEEFRWTVGEYIAYGQQNALDGAWMKQLENASARVHISRLEAIQLQLQQQAERLYGNQLDVVDTVIRGIYLGSYYGTAFELQRGLGVGWTMQAIDERTIQKVLSRPWTADGLTFRDRCWTNKQALVRSVNTNLTQMIIRGEAPDRAINAIAHQFSVAKDKAGRLVMTEAAAFSSAAQKDCYKDLEVEQYKVVATFDGETCPLCGDLDGKVFKQSDYQVGLTAPPFHPWCRCCTCPYFADMEGVGERWARNPDGTTTKVPADMTFDQWRKKFAPGANTGLTPPQQDAIINPMNGQDVTKEYFRAATPGRGTVTYEDGYSTKNHQAEITMSEWLHRTFGGEITLLKESPERDVKTPDYLWNGKKWELKSAHSINGADKSLQHAIKQIQDNPGGVILDILGEVDMKKLERQLLGRFLRSNVDVLDVMLLSNGDLLKILRHKK